MGFLNKRCNHSIIIILLSLLSNSCQDRIFEKTVALDGVTNEYQVDLSRLPFDWENVYFFQGDYSDTEIEAIIGAKLPDSTDIAYFVVVFIAKGRVVYEECWYHSFSYNHYCCISGSDRRYDSLSVNSPIINVRPIERRIDSKEWYEINVFNRAINKTAFYFK